LHDDFGYSKTQLKTIFKSIPKEEKIHQPRLVNLVVDATFFGKKETGQWGVVVFRDAKEKENLWWEFVYEERVESYQRGKREILALGYSFNAVTCDGLPGLVNVFNGIPVQFCHFHQTQIVRRYVTENPKLQAGHDLLDLVKTLTLSNQNSFTQHLNQYLEKHRAFLNEKTIDILTNKEHPTHQRLLSAIRSLKHNIPYLFTYQKHPELFIPNTTNTLESHFSHIKDILRIHRGLTRSMKQKMIHAILLNSSIVLKLKRKE
jgi:hypothetical protein